MGIEAMTREDIRREERPRRLFRCSDGYCGNLDCARCHSEAEVLEFLDNEKDAREAEEREEECP